MEQAGENNVVTEGHILSAGQNIHVEEENTPGQGSIPEEEEEEHIQGKGCIAGEEENIRGPEEHTLGEENIWERKRKVQASGDVDHM